MDLLQKKMEQRFMDFFGILVSKFQLQLSNTFKFYIIEAYFHCDEDFGFLCFIPAPEYIKRLTEFGNQLIDIYRKEIRFQYFAFNTSRCGLQEEDKI